MNYSSPNLNTISLALYHAASEPSNLVPVVLSYSSSGTRSARETGTSSGEPWKRSWEPTRKFKTGLWKVSFAIRLRDCSYRSCDSQLSCLSSTSYFLLLIISIRSFKFWKQAPGLIFFKGLFEGLIFGRAYIRRGLIKYEGELSFQNRLSLYLEEKLRLKIGWANLWLEGKFMSVICRKVLLKLALRT